MKVIIAGSRHMPEEGAIALIDRAMKLSGFDRDVTEVVSGCAKGADTWGEHWAEQSFTHVIHFPANWTMHGKAAGPIRNAQMAEYADAAVIFIWNGSRGSANMLQQMQKRGKPCFVVLDGDIDTASLMPPRELQEENER